MSATAIKEARGPSEAEYRRLLSVLDVLPAYVILLTPDYHVTFSNRFFRERFGESRGRRCFEFLFGRSEPCEVCESFKVFQTGELTKWQWKGPDGRQYDIVDLPFRDVDGSSLVLEMGTDITERLNAQLELHRLNRALKALNGCTDALVRATDESSLLQQVCDIFVQVGGYPLAWVGYAEEDQDKTVRPVAIAGLGSDYVRSVGITWADTERGQGPTGTAIRTGRPCYITDIAADPRFNPWREAASQHLYASAIAVPLKDGERSMGAISVYAPERDAFDQEERQLMVELACNLSHGILAFRIRNERDRMDAELRTLNDSLERRERELERLVQDLAERERKYRELFELTNEAIIIFEPGHEIILEANPFACSLYGYEHEELVGLSLKRLTRDIERGEQQIAELLAYGSCVNFESVHFRRDGSPLHILASSKVISYGGQRAVLTVNRDITRLKNAEEELRRTQAELEERVRERTAELGRVNAELRRSRDEWQATFDGMSDAITVHSPDFRVLRCNRAFREMFPDADLETAHCYELVHGLDHPPETCPLARTVAGRRSEVCELYEPHLSRFISIRTDPMFDDEGNLYGIVHTISDISERKEIEGLKNEFVGRVSHELRTPLSSLRGFAELMLQNEYPPEKRRQFLTVIHRESERLGSLINDVLDIQRIESGQQVLRFVPVTLPQIARDTVEVFASAHPQHRFVVDLPDELPAARGDTEMLHQIMNNLVSNAIKYSPEGGEVRLTARPSGSHVLVSVSDQGIGIPGEALSRIFSKFYRVENAAARKIGGTGLGLALVKDIVELHGGRVWAESVLYQGSTFYFTLPLWEENEGQRPA